ncbi:N-acetyltransferase domain-containing protein [Candidatus Magnetomoraceae bacterium gMMP-15]
MIKDRSEYHEKINHLNKFGCKVNAVSVSELFEHYSQVGFLYPEKKKQIEPYLTYIKDNWEKALSAGREILWTVSFHEPELNRMGTVSLWRSTKNGWVAQHLTSTGYPAAVCAIMLTTQVESILKDYQSGQNWFRPANKYASKVFGRVVATIGEEFSSVNQFKYLSVKKEAFRNFSSLIEVKKCNNNNHYEIYDFAVKIRGKVFADAEGLNEDDIELHELDEIYRNVGLSRRRYIWMAFCSQYAEPVGAIIVYRGPLGFNFSLIENRCDLLIDKNLNDEQAELVCKSLINNAKFAYFDSDFPLFFPLNYMLLVADDRCAKLLLCSDIDLIREYNQSIWLKEGFITWYNQTETIFKRVLDREERKLARKNN